MNLQTKLRLLEKMMTERMTPGQEQLVAAYFKTVLDKEVSIQTMDEKYEVVKEFVPKMH